jgi:predicted DNA-binding transcriptional regulator AlpA
MPRENLEESDVAPRDRHAPDRGGVPPQGTISSVPARQGQAGKFRGRSGAIVVSNHMHEDHPQPNLALLKPTALAAQLGVSRAWLYEAAKTGRIPSIRIGGHEGPLRFVPEDIQRWIDDARAEWVPGRSARPTRPAADVMHRGSHARPRARR